MTEILRVKTTWTGFTGAPGFTNFYFRDFAPENVPTQEMADNAVGKVSAFWTTVANYLPAPVILTIDSTVDRVEETDGKLQGFFTTAAVAPKQGGSAQPYAAPAGACISWGTSGVRNGRRIRGRTFIVPVSSAYYQSDGTLQDAFAASLRAAAVTLRSEAGVGDLGVWARPSVKGATDGSWTFATSSQVNDKVAMLTSRRS